MLYYKLNFNWYIVFSSYLLGFVWSQADFSVMETKWIHNMLSCLRFIWRYLISRLILSRWKQDIHLTGHPIVKPVQWSPLSQWTKYHRDFQIWPCSLFSLLVYRLMHSGFDDLKKKRISPDYDVSPFPRFIIGFATMKLVQLVMWCEDDKVPKYRIIW